MPEMKWLIGFALALACFCHAEERYSVSLITMQYATENAQLPQIAALKNLEVSLGVTSSGYVAAAGSKRTVTMPIGQIGMNGLNYFYRSGLVAISDRIVQYFHSQGIQGVRVTVDPRQISREGKDLRAPGNTMLTYMIYTAHVGQVRTVAGDQVNCKKHAHIKKHAPISENDVLQTASVEDYVFYLNRHPNRRVDLEMGAFGSPGLAGVDFVVSEEKPWRIYGSVANTGPETIEQWQQVFGYVNTQLTGFDDIFILDYATDSFNDYYSVVLSYDRPFASFRRLRWNIEGAYRQFDSAQLGFGNKRFRGDFWEADFGLLWNFYQKRDFFADAFLNLQYNYISVDNQLVDIKGHEDFFIPEVGLRLSRLRPTSTLFLETEWQGPINGITDVKESNINRLGRLGVDKNWSIWTGTSYGSYFADERLVNELYGYMQWQYAFNNRLIPEYESVLGGLYSVRGYPTATIAGDSTITATAEYRLHLVQLLRPRSQPLRRRVLGRPFYVAPQYTGGRADWDFILRLFFDIGSASVKQASNRLIARDPEGTLMGTGFGGELIFRQNIFIRGDFAWALKGLDNPTVADIEPGHFEPYLSVTVMY